MNLIFLQASALIATTHAFELPSLSALRGAVTAGLGASCDDGYRDGQTMMFKIWNDKYEADCMNSWYLEGEANELIDREFSDNSNWQKESYNECAIKAVRSEVASIEQACLAADPSQCIDLGNTAAEIVVERNWCEPAIATPYGVNDEPNYKAECKELATNQCKGMIYGVTKVWCYYQTPSSHELKELQDKCEDQVDSMVPGEGERLVE